MVEEEEISLKPEKVAYWYFRLNGFLQIENFIIHPRTRGSQRTDGDLLAVRFPHRAERLFDNPDDIMIDDEAGLALSNDLVEIVFVEIATNQPCKLNDTWVDEEKRNIHRALAALGCVSHHEIETAAASIYETGVYQGNQGLRIRLVAVGRTPSKELSAKFPNVIQLTWVDVLKFIAIRFKAYHKQKTQVDQWGYHGTKLHELAGASTSVSNFTDVVLSVMGARRPDQ